MKPFRLFDLPLELRWRVYGYMMPSGGRILLDPKNIYHPLPYSAQPCEDALNMMVLSRHVYAEVSEFLYSSNTITRIHHKTKSITQTSKFRPRPGEWIRTLELHSSYHGPKELQIVEQCPNLQTLFVVLYHEMHWHKVFAALAERAFAKTKKKHHRTLRLDIDLYTSIVAGWDPNWMQRGTTAQRLDDALDSVNRDLATRNGGWRKLPASLKHIVMTVSVTRDTTRELLEWRGRDDMAKYFKRLSYQRGPPEMTRVTWATRTGRE
jgi:hypothetical protein